MVKDVCGRLRSIPFSVDHHKFREIHKKEQTLNNEVKGSFRSQIKGEIFTEIIKVARLEGTQKGSY